MFSSYLFLAINFTKFLIILVLKRYQINLSQLKKNLCIFIWVWGSEICDKLDLRPFWVFWSLGKGYKIIKKEPQFFVKL